MLRSLLLLPLLLAGPAGASPPVPTPAAPAAGAPVVGTVPPPAIPPGIDAVRRVPVSELQQALKAGNVVVVDVRSKDDYAASHAKGALSIPLADIEQRSKELPRESFIVTYCT
jgi:3-mercaptopyruvate sulfurtransferase SseA